MKKPKTTTTPTPHTKAVRAGQGEDCGYCGFPFYQGEKVFVLASDELGHVYCSKYCVRKGGVDE